MTETKEVAFVNASRRNPRMALWAVATATAGLLLPHVVAAQAPPPATQPAVASPAQPAAEKATPAAEPAPSAAAAVVIADAQAKVKAGQFAEAVAELTAAETPGMAAADKQSLDFCLAQAELDLGQMLVESHRYDEAREHVDHALAIDSVYPDRKREAGIDLRRLGAVAEALGLHDKAIDCYKRSLSIARQVGDNENEATTLGNLGNAYIGLMQYSTAIDFYDQALRLHRNRKDADGEQKMLPKLANAYYFSGQYAQAISFFEQTLPTLRQTKNRADAGKVLNILGSAYSHLHEYGKALSVYRGSLAAFMEVGNREEEAEVLANMGNLLRQQGHPDQAVVFYDQALQLFRALKNQSNEARTLIAIGNVWFGVREYAKAIDLYNQALPVLKSINNEAVLARTLNDLSLAYAHADRFDEAIHAEEQAIPIFQRIKNRKGEANALTALGNASRGANRTANAIGYYDQALAILHNIKDEKDEANTLAFMGNTHVDLGHFQQAIDYLEQALSLARTIKDQEDEENALNSLGCVYLDLTRYSRATDLFSEALALAREAKEPGDEAYALNNLGNALVKLGKNEKAIAYFGQALPILRQIRDHRSEARTLTNLGTAYRNLSQYERAIDSDQQALSLARQIGDVTNESIALNNLAVVFSDLGDHQKAVRFCSEELSLARRTNDLDGEAASLMNIGIGFDDLSQHAKAIDFYGQALPIFRRAQDRYGEMEALCNSGVSYNEIHQFKFAQLDLSFALTIARDIKDRNVEATALLNLGITYEELGNYQQALHFLDQSLPIFQEVKDRNGEAKAFANLALTWSASSNPTRNTRLATFFCKKAVDVFQSIRANIRALDKQTQQGYIRWNEPSYRILSELLIDQDRLPEVIQVLDLLKQEEYLNFTQVAPAIKNAVNLLSKPVDVTRREALWNAKLASIESLISRDAAIQGELAIQTKLKPDTQDLVAAATEKLLADETTYHEVILALTQGYATPFDAGQDRLLATSNSRELRLALQTLGDGSAALYTQVSSNRVRLVLVSQHGIVSRGAPLREHAALDKKVVAFRAVLQDPLLDPRPLGKQFYDLLIGPIKADLVRAHARTLLVSLDGNLRYIPLAALSPDGKHYLIETYRTALYTPAAIANLMRQPKAKWTALAMGTSKPQLGFKALAAVPDELKAVARTEGETGPSAGQFPGMRFLDDAFTKSAMVSALGKNYPLVHIASHFKFTGDETTSFLLLGDGSHLTLSDLKALPEGIFAGVNLLTLSACETATGGIAINGPDNGNGSRDVENVAVLAQRKGADAVLASLWSVSDESTGLLMRTFYRDRQGGGSGGLGESKAEALRQAQIALLTGGVKVAARRPIAATTPSAAKPPTAGAPKRSELLSPAPATKAAVDAPAFTPESAKPWSHPYYWAPFILIGNWK